MCTTRKNRIFLCLAGVVDLKGCILKVKLSFNHESGHMTLDNHNNWMPAAKLLELRRHVSQVGCVASRSD